MPSVSEKQRRFFSLVKAVKAGHRIQGLSPETRKRMHEAAASMTDAQLTDYARKKKKK